MYRVDTGHEGLRGEVLGHHSITAPSQEIPVDLCHPDVVQRKKIRPRGRSGAHALIIV